MEIGLIFSSFSQALSQTGDRRFRRVMILGIALTIALLIATYVVFLLLLQWLVGPEATLPLIGEVTWLRDLLSWTSLLVMMVLSVFLMIPVASAITSMFLEDVAQAVEDRHYPALPPADNIPFGEALRDTISFLGVLIGANLVALFLWGILLLTGVGALVTPILFWLLNGYLLGREYFQLVAMRRVGREGAKALRKRHSSTIWAAGTLMAVPLSFPLVSLIIPILGAATFTHLFHALRKR